MEDGDRQGHSAMDEDARRELVEGIREKLTSVVAYTLLLGTKDDLPEDVSACLLHVSRLGAELNVALRRLPCLNDAIEVAAVCSAAPAAPGPDPRDGDGGVAVMMEGWRHA